MRIFPPLFLVALLAGLSGCSGLSYIAENGVGQWRMFNRARPVDDVLLSPHTKEDVRQAISTVRKGKTFALKLGLKATGNYESFVQLDSPCVVWAVSAAHPLLLEEKTWQFPIVGEIPYLGFFKKASAEAEEKRLLGSSDPQPDTWVRCVPAFSSLGWFSDPLYSSMLKGKERDIVELVVHESLHATVWVKGSVDFNEKLANFVGLVGGLRYAEETGGAAGLELAKKEVEGEKLFGDFLHLQESTYKAEVKTDADKAKFYETLLSRYGIFQEKERSRGRSFESMKAKFEKWNNAALLTYLNYYSDMNVFEAMLKSCGSDLGRFVRWISAENKKGTGRFLSAPEEHLADLVKESSCGP